MSSDIADTAGASAQARRPPNLSPLAELDVATVVAVSQALSAEIVFDALVERLMVIAVESAGAARGLLTLPCRGELAIEAQATRAKDGVTVRLASIPLASGELASPDAAESIVRHVARTHERVVAGDALCLPLVKQDRLMGVLYLERDAAPDAFTPHTIALLEVLAAQAAISLENARLHTDLQTAQDRVRAAERESRVLVDTIPGLVWCARPDGSVEFLNRPWLEYTGLSIDEARDWGWAVALHPVDAPRVQAVLTSILSSGALGEVEARLRRHDGVYRWFLLRAQAMRDDRGRITRWYGTNTDIEDLKRAESALRRSEDFLNEAQRISHTGSFTWNPASGDITWSDETHRIYEIDRSVQPTLTMVTGRTHPEDVARTRAFLERAAHDGLDWEDERRLVMPDGRIKHVQVIAHALSGDDGTVTFAGAVKDVTLTKLEEARLQKALQDKEALLTEIHHRVKNNLQLVSSMLSLQATRGGDRHVVQLFAESRNRVRSMALVHENLYRAGDFGQVAMAGHITSLCEQLAHAYRTEAQPVDVTVTSADLHLDMDRAVLCGLIINELVSNAFKHAFPNGRQGRVSVDLVSADGHRCVLTVRDDGISLPPGFDLGRDGSLGLQLVNDLAEQLHGTVVVRREAGTIFTITFDASSIGRAGRAP